MLRYVCYVGITSKKNFFFLQILRLAAEWCLGEAFATQTALRLAYLRVMLYYYFFYLFQLRFVHLKIFFLLLEMAEFASFTHQAFLLY